MSGGPALVRSRATVIVGGAGFVGSNLADRIATAGGHVLLFDNLSRPGVERNAAWLADRHGKRVTIQLGDLRDAGAVADALKDAERVFHLAAQVAVTTSLTDPRTDFATNAAGTLNILEALRARPAPPPLVFTSTNKVYGELQDVAVVAAGDTYRPADGALGANGFAEDRPLAFCSPYGCSKGAADQYVIDYARTFGLRATVFRMSCIFGPRQFGTEDQGWVAHFVRAVLEDRPITIFGDGRQVRDLLFVGDLVDALLEASDRIERLSGQAFNIGGGPQNAVSLLEVLRHLAELTGRKPIIDFGPWRPGDQLFYVSDTRRFAGLTGWRPRTGVAAGLRDLIAWMRSGDGAQLAQGAAA